MTALKIAKPILPDYWHKFSPQKFTLPQLLACLVLKITLRTDFNEDAYGQRWQVETVYSMIKRNQGSELRARSYWSQCREMLLKVLTHNIAIIQLVKELFYRACLTPIFLRSYVNKVATENLWEKFHPNASHAQFHR